MLLISFLLAGQASTPAEASGITRFVSPTGVNTGTCTTWAHACNLQRALAAVAISGDQLWVKAGTYRPTSGVDRTVSFVLKNGVKIYGGFVGTETLLNQRNPTTHITLLSGGIGGTSVSDNSYHVVYSSPAVNSTAVLDGFTIKAGNGSGGALFENLGGGLLSIGGSPTLSKLTFANNSAFDGGGMFIGSSSNPILTGVTFSGNSATNNGGGIYTDGSRPTLTNVTFSGNSAVDGGGMANTNSSFSTLTNVTFNANPASNAGGGMYNNASYTQLANVTFSGNSADFGGGLTNENTSGGVLANVTFSGNSATYGGGMLNVESSAPILRNVTFSGNKAVGGGSGGGMYNSLSSAPSLENVTFSGNSATGAGGGMYNSQSYLTMWNLTFSGNSATSGGGGMYNASSHSPGIYDSVFWNDGSGEILNDSTTPTIVDSLIGGGCPTGATCSGTLLTTDPLLGLLANNGGFTKTMALGAGSPAIDSGNDSTCTATDQRGVTRPQGAHCDMGAYEAPATVSFESVGAQDGWVRESGENTNVGGGTPNSAGMTLMLGDDATRKQYRSILSFNTTSLPNNATISSVQLKLKYSSWSPAATNPMPVLHGIMLDVRKGFFGTSALQLADFQQVPVGTVTVGPFSPGLSAGFYTITLSPASFTQINLLSTTQIRVRFQLDDNNDAIANTLNLVSGNNATPANQPTLIIGYTTP